MLPTSGTFGMPVRSVGGAAESRIAGNKQQANTQPVTNFASATRVDDRRRADCVRRQEFCMTRPSVESSGTGFLDAAATPSLTLRVAIGGLSIVTRSVSEAAAEASV